MSLLNQWLRGLWRQEDERGEQVLAKGELQIRKMEPLRAPFSEKQIAGAESSWLGAETRSVPLHGRRAASRAGAKRTGRGALECGFGWSTGMRLRLE